MSSIIRSVLGAGLLLTGASTAMAQTVTSPAATTSVQTSASTTAPLTTGAPAAQAAAKRPTVSDKSDPYGGHDPNSLAGAREFWQGQNPY